MENRMLTTIDNPYNPFTQFNDWFRFDTSKGYNSSQLLARIAKTSIELSFEENDLEIEEAIDTILKEDVTGIYIAVTENSFKPPKTNSLLR